MAFKYTVRLTKLLEKLVEVEAGSTEEAEDKAFKIANAAPLCDWDDLDIQVEDDTVVFVPDRRGGGEYRPVKSVPVSDGGEKEEDEED